MNLNAFLTSIEEEYGKYYTLNKFEVRHNDENKEIYKESAITSQYKNSYDVYFNGR